MNHHGLQYPSFWLTSANLSFTNQPPQQKAPHLSTPFQMIWNWVNHKRGFISGSLFRSLSLSPGYWKAARAQPRITKQLSFKYSEPIKKDKLAQPYLYLLLPFPLKRRNVSHCKLLSLSELLQGLWWMKSISLLVVALSPKDAKRLKWEDWGTFGRKQEASYTAHPPIPFGQAPVNTPCKADRVCGPVFWSDYYKSFNLKQGLSVTLCFAW